MLHSLDVLATNDESTAIQQIQEQTLQKMLKKTYSRLDNSFPRSRSNHPINCAQNLVVRERNLVVTGGAVWAELNDRFPVCIVRSEEN